MIAICAVIIVMIICQYFTEKHKQTFEHEEKMAKIKAGLIPSDAAEGGIGK